MKAEFIFFLTLSLSLSASSARRHTDKQNVSVCVSEERKSLLENSDAFSSPSTLGIFPSTYAHRDALAIRVTARAWRESRGCQCFLGVDLKGKKNF